MQPVDLSCDAASNEVTAPDLPERLMSPDVYPDRPSWVRREETHISWVFLTDRYAYKLKKPVRFDFLDFSTPEARHDACQEELRLNRRLAPEVYMKVVPVGYDDRGRIEFYGKAPPVDWLVKMRRLPAERTLEALIASHEITASQVRQIASLLVRFFCDAAPLTIKPERYSADIKRHVQANARELLQDEHAWGRQVQRVTSAQLRFLALDADMLHDRACDGRILDGHGDLRPEHIYLTGSPVVIDCLEFNEDLRKLDVADELAFLSMECERLDAKWVGDLVLEQYERASGDRPPEKLLNFYKLYRANVRAKVAALRAGQLPDRRSARQRAQMQAYLDLADRYAQAVGPPLLMVVGGLMGSGKSTLATQLAATVGAELLQTDSVRRQIFEPAAADAPYDTGPYARQHRLRVYDQMFRQAEACLREGLSVVLDGTFLYNSLRDRAHRLASQCGATPRMIWCQCPTGVSRKRIEERVATGPSASDGRPDLVDEQKQEREPIAGPMPCVTVDTTTGLAAQVADALAGLDSA